MQRSADSQGAGAAERFDVVGLGYNTIDHLCVLARQVRLDTKQQMVRYERQPGGQVPTALVALQRWGFKTAYLGAFGGDPSAALARDSLAREGVDLRGACTRSEVPNQESVILIDEVTGERSVLWQRPAGLELRAEELPADVIRSARLFLTDGYDLAVAVSAARWAREAGAFVMLDIDFPASGVEELLALTDCLVASAEFPLRYAGEGDLRRAMRKVAASGPRICVATLGLGGVLWLEQGRFGYLPAFRVPVVDATGAGDVFHAGFAVGVLRAWPTERTIRFAAAAAALKCRKLGGRPGIPSVEEAEQLADSRAGRVFSY